MLKKKNKNTLDCPQSQVFLVLDPAAKVQLELFMRRGCAGKGLKTHLQFIDLGMSFPGLLLEDWFDVELPLIHRLKVQFLWKGSGIRHCKVIWFL